MSIFLDIERHRDKNVSRDGDDDSNVRVDIDFWELVDRPHGKNEARVKRKEEGKVNAVAVMLTASKGGVK